MFNFDNEILNKKMSTLEFNKFLELQKSPLHFFALKLTSNEEEAKDLVQETFLKALTYRSKLITKASVKGWLYTIMKNTFINQYRRESKFGDIMNQFEHQGYVSTSTSQKSISPDKAMSVKDIEQSIDDLPEVYKVPFKMKLEGYKYQEISDYVAVPVGTIKSRIFLARKLLMENLKDYNPKANA